MAHDGLPHLERLRDGRIYFVDEDRVPWRVYDAAFGPPLAPAFRHRVLPHGDPRARYRIFVPQDQTASLRIFDFKREGGDRRMTLEILTVQHRTAGFAQRWKPPAPAEKAPYLGG